MNVLKDIAKTTADIIKSNMKEDAFSVIGRGPSGDLTKRIDLIAEEHIVSRVENENLALNILSEECGFIDKGEARTLIVDPVDGTFNCTHAIPFFAVSLAVAEKSMEDISHAVVYSVMDNKVYWAEKGKGAFLDDMMIRPRKFDPSDTVFSINFNRSAHDCAVSVAKHAKRVRVLGSASLEICWVAEGKLDLYMNVLRGGSLRVVDIAAASFILREAGGDVFNGMLRRLNMPLDVKKRENVVAVGDLRALKLLDELLRGCKNGGSA
ncbi:MAG: hypothetical protein DRN20_04675 [Thermoplasmata archaeon]|nr:MAG: hypothetical protein DRN20_04675 [Thermoplasmata archaeon]